MANQTLAARSAFTGFKPLKTPRLGIEIRDNLTVASIAIGNGMKERVQHAIAKVYGVDLPNVAERVQGKDIAFIWSGPDQWIAVAERGAGRDLEIELKLLLAGLASVVDQSDGRAIVRISGPDARNVLAKGVPIDLHPSVFGVHSVAITHASHIGVLVWQIDEAPTYEIAMFRSFADSFAHWLSASSSEFTNSVA